MKNLFLILTILIGFTPLLHAQNQPVNADSIEKVRNNEIQIIRRHLLNADSIADNTNSFIDGLPVGQVLTDYESPIKFKLSLINGHLTSIKNSHLRDLLTTKERINYDTQFNRLYAVYSQMTNILAVFYTYEKPIYNAQTDYMGRGPDRFLRAISSFNLYMQLLVKSPLIKTTDWAPRADSLLKQYLPIKIPDSCCKATNKITINLLKDKDSIRNVQKSYKHYAIFSGYTDNIFGLSFFQAIGKTGQATSNSYIGAEFVTPIRSTRAKNPGGFILYGLSDGKLFMQAGVGYLKVTEATVNILSPTVNQNPDGVTQTVTGTITSNQDKQSISWKAAIVYTPHKIGLGVSYSPLTKAGVHLAYRW